MSNQNLRQISNIILMVRPVDFAFNEQTAADNEFQNVLTDRNVGAEALAEFDGAVALLRAEGVQVLIVEKDPASSSMPDAVFPNNWFGTDELGNVHVFPMKTENRRAETSQLTQALSLLKNQGLEVSQIQDWTKNLGDGAVMEGTGSLILDRVNKIVYAALSERTQKEPTLQFARETGYDAVLFHTQSSKGAPYYHTNVVMSIGEKMALVCLDCIPDPMEREWVRTSLDETHHVLAISREQLEKGFCGNLLQVQDGNGNPVTVLSSTAYSMLTESQKKELETFGKLLPVPIPTIEAVGGGSIRCMMAEIFCPAKG
ncbi:MAG TPA: arginine deiminase-related protein [Catalimonadaceae bacterium]|nr:arginine deiminase-related protein [Catalimonadaceae bacterium]